MTRTIALVSICVLVATLQQVAGHGRLIKPPSRASAWRFGFDTSYDYNDNSNNCGGQWAKGCGICGDSYDDPEPRPHEAGGRWGSGVLVAHYRRGQRIRVLIQITANHMGYFIFKLCANNDVEKDPGQECFDNGVLNTTDGRDKWVLPDELDRTYMIELKLPANLTCTQCILQWTYKAGNSFGRDEDGEYCLGCGYQEMFRACADIAISARGGSLEEATKRLKPRSDGGNRQKHVPGKPRSGLRCLAAGAFTDNPKITEWCNNTCGHFGGDCPPSHCKCFES